MCLESDLTLHISSYIHFISRLINIVLMVFPLILVTAIILEFFVDPNNIFISLIQNTSCNMHQIISLIDWVSMNIRISYIKLESWIEFLKKKSSTYSPYSCNDLSGQMDSKILEIGLVSSVSLTTIKPIKF